MDITELRRLLIDDAARTSFSPDDPAGIIRAARRHRYRRTAAAAVVALALVGGGVATVITTTGGTSGSPATLVPAATPTTPTTDQSGKHNPEALIGMWSVKVASPEKEPADDFDVTALRLSGKSLIAFTRCGEYTGRWQADARGSILAAVDYTGGNCPGFNTADSSVPMLLPRLVRWLQQATFYAVMDGDVLLYDAHRRLTARLTPGANVGSRPYLDPSLTRAPVIDASVDRLVAPVQNPGGNGSKVTLDAVTGRWRPIGAETKQPQAYLQLNANGTYEGNDGCNAVDGRWILEPGGFVLASAGVVFQIGCNNIDIPLYATRSMRLTDNQLRLYDVNARLLITLERG